MKLWPVQVATLVLVDEVIVPLSECLAGPHSKAATRSTPAETRSPSDSAKM